MSLLELHDLLLDTYYFDGPATPKNGPRENKTSPLIATCYGAQFQPVKPNSRSSDAGGKGDQYDVPPRWLYLHYLPRNNFYSEPHPIPLAQGFTWDWPDYWSFLDAKTPRDEWSHRYYTKRRADLNWTLNQVRFAASFGERSGVVNLDMGTFTPNFGGYWCRSDKGSWNKSSARFAWKLHPGENRLEMRVSNTAGVFGPISSITLSYHPT